MRLRLTWVVMVALAALLTLASVLFALIQA